MYELTIYVVSGQGATTIWQDEKTKRAAFEWQAGSLFFFFFFDSTQRENIKKLQWQAAKRPARAIIAVTNAPPMMRLYTATMIFIFNCNYLFHKPLRGGRKITSAAKGKLFKTGRIWEFQLHRQMRRTCLLYRLEEERGAGGINCDVGGWLTINNQEPQSPSFRSAPIRKHTPPWARRPSRSTQRHRRLLV